MGKVNVRLYQINPDRDAKRVIFVDLSRLEACTGTAVPEMKIYDLVFDGEVEVADKFIEEATVGELLEMLYAHFNTTINRFRPMSVSDVVEFNGRFFFCDSIGFREIEWKERPL